MSVKLCDKEENNVRGSEKFRVSKPLSPDEANCNICLSGVRQKAALTPDINPKSSDDINNRVLAYKLESKRNSYRSFKGGRRENERNDFTFR